MFYRGIFIRSNFGGDLVNALLLFRNVVLAESEEEAGASGNGERESRCKLVFNLMDVE